MDQAVKIACRLGWRMLGIAGIALGVMTSARAGGSGPLDLSAISNLVVSVSDTETCGGSRCYPTNVADVAYLTGGLPGQSYAVTITLDARVVPLPFGPGTVRLNGEIVLTDILEEFPNQGNESDCCDDMYPDCTMLNMQGTITLTLQPGDPVVLTYNSGTCGVKSGYANVLEVHVDCPDAGCGSQCDGTAFGAGAASLDCIHAQIGLGRSAFGKPGGFLRVYAPEPSLDLANPDALRLVMAREGVHEIATQDVRQVVAPMGVTEIVTNDLFSFEARFHTLDQVGATNAFGLYTLTNTPLAVWRFANPDASTNIYNRYHVTHIRGDVTNRHYAYEWQAASNHWTLVESAGDLERTFTLQVETQVVASVTNTLYHYATYDGATRVSARRETVTAFPWGALSTESVRDPDGLALTNRWLYYTADDVPTDSPDYGRLRARVTESGYWEIYQYAPDGMITNTKAQFLDASYDADPAECRVATVHYFNAEGDESHEWVTREYVFGVQVRGSTIEVPWYSPDLRIEHHGGDRTVRKIDADGQAVYVVKPDFTITLTTSAVDGDLRTTTIDTGARTPWNDPAAVTNGVRTIRVTDRAGRVRSEHRYAIPETDILLSARTNAFDALGRPAFIRHLDGSFETMEYDCCGLSAHRDHEGLITHYEYDAFGRRVGESRGNLTSLRAYDALDRVTRTEVWTGDGPTIVRERLMYDGAGRVTNRVDALQQETHSRYYREAGRDVHWTGHPDGSERYETYYPDGRLHSVTGSAVRAVEYHYGAMTNAAWQKEIRLGPDGDTNEWVRTVENLAGRVARVEYADGSVEENTYNHYAQLIRQTSRAGVTTLYAYNERGEVEYTAVDMNGNNAIDWAGLDRLTRTRRDILTTNGSDRLRVTRQWVWPSNNVDAPLLVSEHFAATNAMESWSIAHGRVRHTRTETDGAGGKTLRTTAPDGTFTESLYATGRLISVSAYTAASQQLTRVSYGYDALGRVETIDDARNGAVSNAYDAADRVIAVTTPPPGDGSPPLTTQYAYDAMGRITAITHPDGGVVSNVYDASGALLLTHGARTYPVAYAYDPQGRMTTMSTWRDFSAEAGQADTHWIYDATNGNMIAKVYDDGTTNRYTYAPGGRLASRIWARGVETVYAYNAAGDLVSVDYSDGTPGVTNVHDRLGRLDEVTDRSGVREWTYDPRGLPVEEVYTDGDLASLDMRLLREYDADGRLLSVTGVGGIGTLALGVTTGQVTYAYDSAGRLAEAAWGEGWTAAYAYHTNSALIASLTFREGTNLVVATTRDYDALNRLTRIAHAPAAAPAAAFAYTLNAAHQRVRCDLADGAYWVYDYDALGQLAGGIKHASNDVAYAGQAFMYAYDDIGNRVTAARDGQNAGYAANALNQYTQRDVPAKAHVLGEADPAATVTVNNQSATRQWGGYFHRALEVDNTNAAVYLPVSVVGFLPNAATSGADIVAVDTGHVFLAEHPEVFEYDADGNLLADGRWDYTWDGENRLIGMETRTGLSTNVPRQRLEFGYDGQGRRIRKAVADWTGSAWSTNLISAYLYDGWNLVAEVVHTPTPPYTHTRHYAWGLDLSGGFQGAGGVGGLLAGVTLATQQLSHPPTVVYTHDGNGNVMALYDETGAEAARYEYAPFGNIIRSTGPAAPDNPFRFSTKYTDSETGLVYYGYRYYSPELGRWLSCDPIGERGGLNHYGFVGNAPVFAVDPLGLLIHSECPIDEWLAQYISSWTRTPVGSFDYSNAGTPVGDPLKSLIVKRMVDSTTRFSLNRDPSETANAELHVIVRVAIVEAAKSASYPPSLGCQYVTAQLIYGPQLDKWKRTVDTKWIPGDWGYIANMSYYANSGPWSSDLAGEHIIAVGIPDSYWGHPVGIRSMDDWFTLISQWTAGTATGDPQLKAPWGLESPQVWYPSAGLSDVND